MSADSLQLLNGFDTDRFVTWLENCLRAQYRHGSVSNEETRYDFDALGIETTNSLIGALTELHTKLDHGAQAHFRAALGPVMRRLSPDRFPKQALIDLTILIERVKAFDALKEFAPVFGSGPWTTQDPALMYYALSVLIGFKGSPDAHEPTLQLVLSKNFAPGYIFDAYKILLRSQPALWVDDLHRVSPYFARQVRKIVARAQQDDLRELWEQFDAVADTVATYVSLWDIGKGILRLLNPDQGPDSEIADRWLLQSLFRADGPFVVNDDLGDGNSWVIYVRADPDKRIDVRMPGVLEVFFNLHSLVSARDLPLDAAVQARLESITTPQTRSGPKAKAA
jgi:hypothetical protein